MNDVKIKTIVAREVLDSRGNPTVEVDVILSDGALGRSLVPSGASTGRFEAHELRDNDITRYMGKGVTTSINKISKDITPYIKGLNPFDQAELDNSLIDLDGTELKSELGANSILGVSMAVLKASAASRGIAVYERIGQLINCDTYTLPVPMFNIINGGRHAEHSTDFQEFMVVPSGFESFSESLRAGVEIYHTLAKILRGKSLATTVGDEGGFAPTLNSNVEAPELVMEAIQLAGYEPGKQCFIALDVAASELTSDEAPNMYRLDSEGSTVSRSELIRLYEKWSSKYPIISIEDGLSEDDWAGWNQMTEQIGTNIQLVGDDLFTTNTTRIKKGIEIKAANSVLIKLNQIGTITETLEAIRLTQATGWNAVISHRSGETEDTIIADLAVATKAGQIKSGAPARGERTAKYNQLVRIESENRSNIAFAGSQIYKQFLS